MTNEEVRRRHDPQLRGKEFSWLCEVSSSRQVEKEDLEENKKLHDVWCVTRVPLRRNKSEDKKQFSKPIGRVQ